MATDVMTYNMIEMLKSGLGSEVKKAVTEQLVKEELANYEAKLREKIEPLVNKISFEGIETIKDLLRIREELHVFLHWKGETNTVVEKSI